MEAVQVVAKKQRMQRFLMQKRQRRSRLVNMSRSDAMDPKEL